LILWLGKDLLKLGREETSKRRKRNSFVSSIIYMQIHSLSKVLSLPLILIAGFFLYRLFSGDHRGEPPFVLIPVVLLVFLYVFYGEIDFWWQKKYPIPLDNKIKEWLINYLPYYNHLDDQNKTEFEKRLSLYVDVREFKVVGYKEVDDVPFDIKNILASQAVKLSLGHIDFLIKDLDRIYLYKHPFPSPKYQFLHTYETDIIDGVIILSLEQALPGIVNPKSYYNITLHAFAEAFVHLNPQYQYPDTSVYGWQYLEKIPFIKKELILATCGFESIDLLIVHIVAFFDYSSEYKTEFPNEYFQFSKIFNQSP
jgi:hypothetical protein